MKKLFFSFFLIITFDIQSHEFNPAHLVIDEINNIDYIYEATWMYPFKNIGNRAKVNFPKVCDVVSLSHIHI